MGEGGDGGRCVGLGTIGGKLTFAAPWTNGSNAQKLALHISANGPLLDVECNHFCCGRASPTGHNFWRVSEYFQYSNSSATSE